LVTYDFAVKNVGHKSDEFAIEASSSLGWGDLSSLPSSVVLSPDEVIDFSVPVTIPMVPRGTTDHLKLRAQSVTNPRMASVKTTFTIAAAQVPSADAGPDQKVEANESGDASVFLDGSNSLSPTGDPLEFFWSGPFEDGGGTSSEESPSVSLRVGIHTISLVVGDGVVWSSADTVTITVVPSPTVVPACVESQGYWKNKPSEWPLGELTIGYMTYSQPEAMDILHQPVRGNGLVSLSKQLIAAKLNQARLIWVPEDVQTAILAADELIGPRIVPPIGSDKVKTRETGALNDLLDTYNSGQHEEGPYSCEE
jgi:hypothetical protein